MAIVSKTLAELETTERLSHPIWYRGGGSLPLVFTVAAGPTFFGLNFDEFFDPATGLIRASALPPGCAPITLDADADLVLSLTGQEIGLDDQVMNTVFAGPAAGVGATPVFRALVDADIPAAIARDAEVTAAVGAHAAAGDPHTAYILEALFDANTFLYATSDDTPEAKTRVEVMALLSGQAGATFSFNNQNISDLSRIILNYGVTPAITLKTLSGALLVRDGADVGLAPLFALSGTYTGLLTVGGLRIESAGILTISSGAVTATGSHHTIDTEDGDAEDDLDTINGGIWGELLFISPWNDAHTIVIKHDTGNISCVGQADVTLANVEDFAILIYDFVNTKWFCLGSHMAVHEAAGDVHHTEAHVLNTSGPHTGSLQWSDVVADIVNADVNAAAAILESKLSLNFATHAAAHQVQVSGGPHTGSLPWGEVSGVDIVNADVNAAAAIAESKLALSFATHAAAHALATTGPHTGTLPWGDLSKTGSSLADLVTRTHASLSDAPANAHHVAFVQADADLLYDVLGGLTAHVIAADPHTGYQKESEKGAVSGYMGLDANQYGTDPPQAHVHGGAGSGGALYSVHQYVFAPDAAPGISITASNTNPQGIIHHSGPSQETAKKMWVNAETAPGTNAVIKVKYGDTDTLDTVAVWTEIATLTLTDKGINTTSMTNASIPADRLVAMFVDSIAGAGAKDVSVTLRIWRPLES